MKLLIIEDDKGIAKFIENGLKQESYAVDVVENGEQGLRTAKTNGYDLIVLDLYLPDINGLKVAKGIREKKQNVPIIVLTGEPKVEVKVKMLECCDDYITKPFSIQELVARIKAVLRRERVVQGDILEIDDLKMDIKAHKVTRAGKEIALRNKEFALLEYFMRNPGVVLSRCSILEKVWDASTDPFTNTIDVHIRLLRKKVDALYPKKLIHTVPTRGYKIER